jgi:diguanylate cyclase (GGDEF)-like protein/PAS domain S-box-containing protein
MKLDIATLLFIFCTTSIVQVIGIYIQAKINKRFDGTRYWILGNLFNVIGIFLILIRPFISNEFITIILANMFIILAQNLIYIGIAKFLDRKVKIRISLYMFLISIFSFFYFTYINNNINWRAAILSIAIASYSLLSSFELLRYKKNSIRNSATFLGGVFTFLGVFHIIRSTIMIYLDKINSSFDLSILQISVFVISISASYLCSFSLIIMINQRVSAEEAASQKKFQLIFETSPDFIFISSLENGTILEVNRDFVAGFYKEDLIGKTTISLGLFKNPKERENVVQVLKRDGHCENFELEFVKKDGTTIVGLTSSKIIELNGKICILNIARDITERKTIDKTLNVLSQAIEQSPASIVITDINGNIEYVNRKFSEITGYSYEEAISENPKVLKSDYHSEEYYKNLWETILTGKEWRGEFHNKKKNGELYWESAIISPIFNNRGDIIQILAIKEDISERKRLENELKRQARTDGLTGLSNRRHFMETAEKQLLWDKNNPKENAFLMLDIDFFKKVNDNFGHAIGDIAIKMVADVCKETIRRTDILGRIGGEEFAILLVELNYTDAIKIAERLRLNVENIKLFDNNEVQVNLRVSIGITKYNTEEDSLEDLMIRSDKALYKAKNEGRNRVISQ